MSAPQTVTHRLEDYPGLDEASKGELEKLLRALNTNTDGASQAIGAIQSNPLLSASFWRFKEGPYPTTSSPLCLLVQHRNGATWTTMAAFGTDGKLINEAWIAPTLLNGWANNGSGQAVAGYFKDALGMVHLKGAVTIAAGGQGTNIFVLPVGYRPAEGHLVGVDNYDGALKLAEVGVNASGPVSANVFSNAGGNADLKLNGISFRAEQ